MLVESALAQVLADCIDILDCIDQEKLSVSLYLLNVARLSIPLDNRCVSLVHSLRRHFIGDNGRSVYDPQASSLKSKAHITKLERVAVHDSS